MEDGNYDWQSDVALLHFKNEILSSITVFSNEDSSYRGLIRGKVGLGDEVRELENYFSIEYADDDEVFYALKDNKSIGMELHGASCDLSVDPNQKISAIKVFLQDA